MIVPSPSLRHVAVEPGQSLETGARRWRWGLAAGAVAVLAAGCALAAAGVVPALVGRIGSGAAHAALVMAASLMIVSAGLVPAAIILQARAGGEKTAPRLAWLGGWPQAALSAALAEAAIVAAIGASWKPIAADGIEGTSPSLLLLLGGAAVSGFPLLVFERHLAAAGPEFPEAAALARLLRLPLLALAGGGLAVVAMSAGVSAAQWLVRGLGGLTGFIALETLLRAGARLFAPPARSSEVRALVDNSLAALVLDRCGGGRSGLGATLVDRFGIDLSRSWALGFIRQAALPLAFGLGIVAWAVTALTALGPDQRGVYQRWGAPVAVLGPGLSVHWPWPFGIVRPTEYGTVHEMAVALPVEPGDGNQPATDAVAGGVVDGPAPTDADRLWVEAHPSEMSYLVPGAGTGTRTRSEADSGNEAFEVVDLDLRLVYRIAMTDRAAIAAQTAVADPEALVRAYAGAWLVHTLSSRTLSGLLREDTSRLQQEMVVALQRGLDEAGSGLELLGVVIDAIHPPPGAARAYHGVQAAEIRAAAELANEHRTAITLTGEAREKATMTLNLAATRAEEMKANAAIDRIRFLADVQAQREAGDGLALDRRLRVLERSLAASTLTVIDRRIALQGDTTLDFRSFGASNPAASDAADADIPVGQTPSPVSPPPAAGAPEAPSPANPEDGP